MEERYGQKRKKEGMVRKGGKEGLVWGISIANASHAQRTGRHTARQTTGGPHTRCCLTSKYYILPVVCFVFTLCVFCLILYTFSLAAWTESGVKLFFLISCLFYIVIAFCCPTTFHVYFSASFSLLENNVVCFFMYEITKWVLLLCCLRDGRKTMWTT